MEVLELPRMRRATFNMDTTVVKNMSREILASSLATYFELGMTRSQEMQMDARPRKSITSYVIDVEIEIVSSSEDLTL